MNAKPRKDEPDAMAEEVSNNHRSITAVMLAVIAGVAFVSTEILILKVMAAIFGVIFVGYAVSLLTMRKDERAAAGDVRGTRAIAAYEVVSGEERAISLLELARISRKWGYPLRIETKHEDLQVTAVRALLALSRAVSFDEAREVAREIRLSGHEALALDASHLIALCAEAPSDPRLIGDLPAHRAEPISKEACERIEAEYERHADRPSAVLLQNIITQGHSVGLRIHSLFLTNCSLNAIESAARLRLAMAGVIDADSDYGRVIESTGKSRLAMDSTDLANKAKWEPSGPNKQR